MLGGLYRLAGRFLGTSSPSPPLPRQDFVESGLDLVEVWPRIIASGLPWNAPTSRGSSRNNAGELAEVLNTRFGRGNYVLINLAPLGKDAEQHDRLRYDPTVFGSQVLSFEPAIDDEAVLRKDEGLTLVGHDLFRIAYVIEFWLRWSSQHVVVVHGFNSPARPAAVIAAYLFWKNPSTFTDVIDALNVVLSRWMPHKTTLVLNRTWRQNLMSFNTVIQAREPVAPRRALFAHFLCELKGSVETWDSDDVRVEVWQENDLIWDSETYPERPDDFLWSSGSLKCVLNRYVAGDITIQVFHYMYRTVAAGSTAATAPSEPRSSSSPAGGADASESSPEVRRTRRLVLRYAFHTNTMPSDAIPISAEHVDFFVRGDVIAHKPFSMTLVLGLPDVQRRWGALNTGSEHKREVEHHLDSGSDVSQLNSGPSSDASASDVDKWEFATVLNLRPNGVLAVLAGMLHFSDAHSVFPEYASVQTLVARTGMNSRLVMVALQYGVRDIAVAAAVLDLPYMRVLNDVLHTKRATLHALKEDDADAAAVAVALEDAVRPTIASLGSSIAAAHSVSDKSALHREDSGAGLRVIGPFAISPHQSSSSSSSAAAPSVTGLLFGLGAGAASASPFSAVAALLGRASLVAAAVEHPHGAPVDTSRSAPLDDRFNSLTGAAAPAASRFSVNWSPSPSSPQFQSRTGPVDNIVFASVVTAMTAKLLRTRSGRSVPAVRRGGRARSGSNTPAGAAAVHTLSTVDAAAAAGDIVTAKGLSSSITTAGHAAASPFDASPSSSTPSSAGASSNGSADAISYQAFTSAAGASAAPASQMLLREHEECARFLERTVPIMIPFIEQSMYCGSDVIEIEGEETAAAEGGTPVSASSSGTADAHQQQHVRGISKSQSYMGHLPLQLSRSESVDAHARGRGGAAEVEVADTAEGEGTALQYLSSTDSGRRGRTVLDDGRRGVTLSAAPAAAEGSMTRPALLQSVVHAINESPDPTLFLAALQLMTAAKVAERHIMRQASVSHLLNVAQAVACAGTAGTGDIALVDSQTDAAASAATAKLAEGHSVLSVLEQQQQPSPPIMDGALPEEMGSDGAAPSAQTDLRSAPSSEPPSTTVDNSAAVGAAAASAAARVPAESSSWGPELQQWRTSLQQLDAITVSQLLEAMMRLDPVVTSLSTQNGTSGDAVRHTRLLGIPAATASEEEDAEAHAAAQSLGATTSTAAADGATPRRTPSSRSSSFVEGASSAAAAAAAASPAPSAHTAPISDKSGPHTTSTGWGSGSLASVVQAVMDTVAPSIVASSVSATNGGVSSSHTHTLSDADDVDGEERRRAASVQTIAHILTSDARLASILNILVHEATPFTAAAATTTASQKRTTAASAGVGPKRLHDQQQQHTPASRGGAFSDLTTRQGTPTAAAKGKVVALCDGSSASATIVTTTHHPLQSNEEVASPVSVIDAAFEGKSHSAEALAHAVEQQQRRSVALESALGTSFGNSGIVGGGRISMRLSSFLLPHRDSSTEVFLPPSLSIVAGAAPSSVAGDSRVPIDYSGGYDLLSGPPSSEAPRAAATATDIGGAAAAGFPPSSGAPFGITTTGAASLPSEAQGVAAGGGGGVVVTDATAAEPRAAADSAAGVNAAATAAASTAARFLKMLKLGVPRAAVEHKMTAEGVTDPAVIALVFGPASAAASAAAAPAASPAPPTPTALPPELEKYAKMVKMGIPPPAVRHKMLGDGVDPAGLVLVLASLGRAADADTAPSPSAAAAAAVSGKAPGDAQQQHQSAEAAARVARVRALRQEQADLVADVNAPLGVHKIFSRYFNMLRVGIPLGVVQSRMVAGGLDPTILNRSPTELPPPTAIVPLREDDQYGKYFRMLRVGTPKDAVAHKMAAEGKDGIALDLDPDLPVPPGLGDTSASILTTPAAWSNSSSPATKEAGPKVGQQQQAKRARKRWHWEALPSDRVSGGATIWHELDADGEIEGGDATATASRSNRLQFDNNLIDDDEFERLFTQETSTQAQAGGTAAGKAAAASGGSDQGGTVFLTSDVKRERNVGIGLAKLRLPSDVIRHCLLNLTFVYRDTTAATAAAAPVVAATLTATAAPVSSPSSAADAGTASAAVVVPTGDGTQALVAEATTTTAAAEAPPAAATAEAPPATATDADSVRMLSSDQLTLLEELLPRADSEETSRARAFRGNVARLSEASRFWVAMADVPKSRARAAALAHQRGFDPRVEEVHRRIAVLAGACAEIRTSSRLKRILQAARLLGNKLNSAEDSFAPPRTSPRTSLGATPSSMSSPMHQQLHASSPTAVLAFRFDSLLKLSQTKAFDGETTALRFLAAQLGRRDADALRLAEDLPSLGDASRLTLDSLKADIASLRAGLTTAERLVREHHRGTGSITSISGLIASGASGAGGRRSIVVPSPTAIAGAGRPPLPEGGSCSSDGGEASAGGTPQPLNSSVDVGPSTTATAAAVAVGDASPKSNADSCSAPVANPNLPPISTPSTSSSPLIHESLAEFVGSAQAKLASLSALEEAARASFAALLLYLGEDPGMSPEALFQVIGQFTAALKRSVAENAEADARSARQNRALAAKASAAVPPVTPSSSSKADRGAVAGAGMGQSSRQLEHTTPTSSVLVRSSYSTGAILSPAVAAPAPVSINSSSSNSSEPRRDDDHHNVLLRDTAAPAPPSASDGPL